MNLLYKSTTPILVAKDLEKSFYQPVCSNILRGISLTVQPGETVAIMGPSGVGKSTLLHILGTLDAPTAGSLYIAGKNALIGEAAPIRNRHLGFVFQNYNLLDEYSLLDNVLMPVKISRQRGQEKRARKLLEKVGLGERMDHLAKQLSGGEKQRAAIARALCNDPDLILADEPSGNLDDDNSAMIHELLISSAKSLNKGLIVVTHDHSLAKECDFIYTLQSGKLEIS